MKKMSFFIGILMLCVWPVTIVSAEELMVYPAKGQSPEKMEKDKAACHTWAKKETGVDPVALAQKSTEQPAQAAPKGGRLKGAAKGAGAGALVGAAAGDTGKGAAVGAGAGAVASGAKQRGKAEAQQETEQQQQTEMKKSMEKYNRAYSACLEGKGYTVK